METVATKKSARFFCGCIITSKRAPILKNGLHSKLKNFPLPNRFNGANGFPKPFQIGAKNGCQYWKICVAKISKPANALKFSSSSNRRTFFKKFSQPMKIGRRERKPLCESR